MQALPACPVCPFASANRYIFFTHPGTWFPVIEEYKVCFRDYTSNCTIVVQHNNFIMPFTHDGNYMIERMEAADCGHILHYVPDRTGKIPDKGRFHQIRLCDDPNNFPCLDDRNCTDIFFSKHAGDRFNTGIRSNNDWTYCRERLYRDLVDRTAAPSWFSLPDMVRNIFFGEDACQPPFYHHEETGYFVFHHQVPRVSDRLFWGDKKNRICHHIACKHGYHPLANALTRSNSVTRPISCDPSITGNAPIFLVSISRAAWLMFCIGVVVKRSPATRVRTGSPITLSLIPVVRREKTSQLPRYFMISVAVTIP